MKKLIITAFILVATPALADMQWHTKDGRLASESQYGPFISECVHEVRDMVAQSGQNAPDAAKVMIVKACMWNRGFYTPDMLK
jgi:hypothetical protein